MYIELLLGDLILKSDMSQWPQWLMRWIDYMLSSRSVVMMVFVKGQCL